MINYLKKLDNINESHIFPKSSLMTKVLKCYYEYLFDYFKVPQSKVDISINLISKTLGGYLDIDISTKSKCYIFINKDISLGLMITVIAHELQHAVQLLNGDLTYTKTHILWKGIKYITLESMKELILDLKSTDKKINVNAWKVYKGLPWEVPAWYIQDVVYDNFIKSKHYKEFVKTRYESEKELLKNPFKLHDKKNMF